MVDVHVKCPCGKFLFKKRVHEKGNIRGATKCSSCKRTIEWQIVDTKVYTSIKK